MPLSQTSEHFIEEDMGYSQARLSLRVAFRFHLVALVTQNERIDQSAASQII
jgi:hypothetical protein